MNAPLRRTVFDATGRPRAADDSVDLSPRICVECGGEFTPPAKGPGQHKKFCDAKGKGVCKLTFANREAAHGKVLVTAAKVYAMTRHGRTPEDRELRAEARTEMTRILSSLLQEDRDAGRADRLRDYFRSRCNVDNDYRERRRRPGRNRTSTKGQRP